METTLLSILIGVGLAASCGFRIFVPMLVMSLAARGGHLELASSFEWMASNAALATFGVATLLEIGAYYIPFIDNLLDTVATPSAVVAGAIVTGSQVADMEPFLAWSIAIVAGGGSAGIVQGVTTLTRQLSSLATAGFGNPIFSTVEAGASVGFALLAIVVPVLAVACLLLLAFFGARKLLARRARTEAA